MIATGPDAAAMLLRALGQTARGRAEFLECRSDLQRAREILGLAEKCLEVCDIDGVRSAFRKIAESLESVSSHQAAAGDAFSRARNAVQQAVARLEGTSTP